MNRRQFLATLGAGLLIGGHTPYKQWVVYRQRHLLILSSKHDPATFPLSKKVAQTLLEALPESQARSSLAKDLTRVASLLSSQQMNVVVLSPQDADKLNSGVIQTESPFKLQALFGLGEHLLLGHEKFPARHAYMLSQVLSDQADSLGVAGASMPSPAAGLDLHPGTAAFQAGASIPELPADPIEDE